MPAPSTSSKPGRFSGTEGASQPFFSPDGQWLGFFADGQLKKVQVSGGPPLPIAETGGMLGGASWGSNDVIVFSSVGHPGLLQIPGAGGVPQPLTSLDTTVGESHHRWPEFGPAGKSVFFTSWSGSNGTARIAVASLESGTVTRLSEAGMNPHYTETGHLVYTRSDGSVGGVPFDVGNMTVTGQAIPLLAGVTLRTSGVAELAISRNGSLVYVPGSSALQRFEMVWIDRTGRETPVDSTWTFRLTSYGIANIGWALSPDGSRLAIGLATDAGDDIWVQLLPHGPVSRVSYDGAAEYRPRWMPDGRSVMFVSTRRGGGGLYRRPANGTGSDSLLLHAAGGIWEGAWSPDGHWLLFRTGGGKWQVSNGGSVAPLWARNGSELFYVNANRDMMVTAIGSGAEPQLGERRVLFHFRDELYLASRESYTPYDIGRDGRFIMARNVTPRSTIQTPLIVVANFFEEWKAKVGN